MASLMRPARFQIAQFRSQAGTPKSQEILIPLFPNRREICNMGHVGRTIR